MTITYGRFEVSARDIDPNDPRPKNIVTVNAVRLAGSIDELVAAKDKAALSLGDRPRLWHKAAEHS